MKETKQLQTTTNEKLKSVITSCFTNEEDKILKRLSSVDGSKTDISSITKDIIAYCKLTAVENGLYLRASVHQNDKEYVSSLRNNLIKEFKPKTSSALLILDIAVSAYFRVMRSSAIYNALIQTPEGIIDWTEKERMYLIKELNKQMDLANQQLMSSFSYLREMNSQLPNIKVQTKNAFIARNQQFNAETNP